MRFDECEGYARGYVLTSFDVSTDVGLVFPTHKAARDWCEAKGLDLARVSILGLMDSRAVHWM